MEYRPIFFVAGLLLTGLSVAMIVPAAVDLAAGSPDWRAFVASAGLTLFFGVSLTLTTRGKWGRLGLRPAFLMTSTCWLSIAVFGALPFALSELQLSYTDAFFEAMSGITTTGSTVIVGLDTAPPGLLLWRAMLQWLGGVGFILTAVAILPMLQVGGMQLFRLESSDRSEKVLPRAAQLAVGIAGVYLLLTFAWTMALWAAGMGPFDAVAHAMTTIATGGFSTVDASIGHFDSALIEVIITAGMIAGSLPFVLYVQATRGRFGGLVRDSQIRAFLGILGTFWVVLTITHMVTNDLGLWQALRQVTFNTTSVMTGTGYATQDFGAWGAFSPVAFFVLMFLGGCAGSTTCGIKMFRFQVLYAAAKAQTGRLMRPHGVFVPYYNHQPIPDTVVLSVLSFFFVYVVCFMVLAMALAMMGLDFMTAVSGAATAISNVGPGLGDVIGPASTFASLPDEAKWVLSAGMLLGRLELFTVLVLLVPAFWRN